jgi:hypothetical protein
LFALHVLVFDEAVGVAHTGDVDAGARETVRREPAMHRFVTLTRTVATPVRDLLQDHRRGRATCGPREEQPSSETATVTQRNPDGLDFVDQTQDILMHSENHTRTRRPTWLLAVR